MPPVFVVVALPQCDSIMYTPYKNLLKKLNMQVGKPQKYNLLHPTKPAKRGIILCVEMYWFWICPYWVLNW